jgi:DMSO/TMAO reductase YedYZ molybdopterin-dependent catalytic subunit
MVQSPLKLSLAELKEKFRTSTVIATLQCAGHRRSELATIQPIPGEISWGAEAMSNALWIGIPLRDVLLAAGIDSDAKHVAFTGLDEIFRGGECFGYGGSIPLEKAMEPEVLLAYAMNEEPLSSLHGFPLRVIVPGYIGARSVQWLANIHVQEQPSTNYFQRQAYKLFPPDVQPETANWEHGTMLGDLPLNSLICQPCEWENLASGPVTISGYAIRGEGHQIERVELSIDGGATWTEAPLQARAQDKSDVRKGLSDIILLRYMARRLHLTLRQFEQSSSLRRTRFQVYKLQERGDRMHRIAIYQAENLRLQSPLSFVGFISARKTQLRPSIVQAIQQTDKKLVEELAGAPGVLSYSSFELRNGDWCNLVLLSDAGAKMHIKGSETHKYAAYHLAHSYYDWIRLHNGIMPEGLDHMEMQLLKTRYYTLQPGQQKPSIREYIYEPPYHAESLDVSIIVPISCMIKYP